MPDTFFLIEQTAQIKYLHTIIRYVPCEFREWGGISSSRNKQTGRDEFIFYSNRLMRVLIEYALSLLPFEVRGFSFVHSPTIFSLGCHRGNTARTYISRQEACLCGCEYEIYSSRERERERRECLYGRFVVYPSFEPVNVLNRHWLKFTKMRKSGKFLFKPTS